MSLNRRERYRVVSGQCNIAEFFWVQRIAFEYATKEPQFKPEVERANVRFELTGYDLRKVQKDRPSELSIYWSLSR